MIEAGYLLAVAVGVFLAVRGFRIPLGTLVKFRIPLLFDEKVVLKSFYGVGSLEKDTLKYQERGFERLVTFLPLLILNGFLDKSWVVISLILFFWVWRLDYLQMKKQVRKWQIEFYKKYPTFVNTLKMHLKGGLTLENSLDLYFQKQRDCHYLEYLRVSLARIRLGKSRKEAFIEVINHTRQREMIHLMNFCIQHMMLGTEDLSYLNHLGEEAWKQKKETVKKLAEEGSAKMVLPMMLIFISVTLLVLVPSIFSLLDKQQF